MLALAGIALPSPCRAGNKLFVKDGQVEPGGSFAETEQSISSSVTSTDSYHFIATAPPTP